MKKTYDFTKGEKNPYYKKLKGKNLQVTEEVSFELSDLVRKLKKTKKVNLTRAKKTSLEKHTK